MSDSTVKKIDSRHSPKGEMGQRYLASGKHVAMRVWEEVAPGDALPAHARPYETVGYVIAGKAELEVAGQRVTLSPGDSWVVPEGAEHNYRILEPFTAVEATSPAARVHGRDEA